VATWGGGRDRYDRNKDQFEHFKSNPKNSNTLSSDLITNMAIDHNDNLWICTENGLNYFETAKRRFTHFLHKKNDPHSISDNNAYCVYEDADHHIWVGSTLGGLNLFDWKTGTFTRYHHDDKISGSISNDNIRVIFEDSKRRLWIGTVGGGLNLFQRESGTFRHFRHIAGSGNSLPNDIIYALGEDNEGNLWIGTENGGLGIFNPFTESFQLCRHDDIDNMSLSNNSIYHIYHDRSGNMWVGTFAGGVNLYKKTQRRFVHYNHTTDKNSLSNNSVMCLTEDDRGKLWIGTDGGGLNVFNPIDKSFTHFLHDERNPKSVCGNYVLSVCKDSKGNIWAGTWATGLSVYNPEKKIFRHFKHDPADPTSLGNNNAWVVYEDHDRNMWVGCYGGGLNLFDPVHQSFIHFNDTATNASKQVYSIAEDLKGNLLIGTDGDGLHVFNKATKTFRRFVHEEGKNSISDNRINHIYRDLIGNFWIGTMAGLNYYDVQKNTFRVFTTADGLPNNVIFAIVADGQGFLWISTDRGLSRFNPKTKTFQNFCLSDGLQSYEYKAHSVCSTHSGALYFGGINGFNEFYPELIKDDVSDPPLVLTNFLIFNKDVPIAANDKDPSPLKKDITETREITLPYNNSVISFEFASLNYSSPEKRKYTYMLEGFDKDWNHVGESRTATYTNLDPGTYIFKVKGMSDDDKWSSHAIQLRLIITPPFRLTWWFRLLVLTLSTGGIYALYRYRVNTIRSQKEKLEKTVLEQTKQLRLSAEEEHKARMEAEKARQLTDLMNRELERKNKELEQFAYVASHDLQEPLRTTSGFADLLQKQYKGRLDERADKYLSFLVDSTSRMKVLIQDLLEYSRIGRKLELVPIDCNRMLEEVISDLGATIQEARAVIHAGNLPTLYAYSTEMKQLFQNLISNAIKFRKKDAPPVVQISSWKEETFWYFSVKDNGIGIDPKHNERIFVIFQRLHTRTEYPGSGIGLAHCKKIVELHKGRMWVESTLGEGSTFYFALQDSFPVQDKQK
jgi:signal transduction histidine kinase/ligand-binding sensor domain-containing protein